MPLAIVVPGIVRLFQQQAGSSLSRIHARIKPKSNANLHPCMHAYARHTNHVMSRRRLRPFPSQPLSRPPLHLLVALDHLLDQLLREGRFLVLKTQ